VKTNPQVDRKELLARIMCGEVMTNGERLRDPKALVEHDALITMQVPGRFVSRGGEKLAHALSVFNINPAGKTFLDAGASTGGFTDCLLQSGAARVYAIDVGYCQLDYRLRRDVRVAVMEKTNITSCKPEMFAPPPDMAVMDLSFRSLRGAASHCISLTQEKKVIALIKPQFEWQNPDEDFSGIVNDPKARAVILVKLVQDLHSEKVFLIDCTFSPILGRKGNKEYFFLLGVAERMPLAECIARIEALARKA
ncbi:MAG: TlyA family RNA methyltransferase, partial [Spirochaetaceae bacterium]